MMNCKHCVHGSLVRIEGSQVASRRLAGRTDSLRRKSGYIARDPFGQRAKLRQPRRVTQADEADECAVS